jgi:hypothetical protein
LGARASRQATHPVHASDPSREAARARAAACALIAGLLALFSAPARVASQAADDAATPSTREMAALLQERAALVNPQALSLVVNDRRADLVSQMLANPLPLQARLPLRARLVTELTNAGRPADGLKALAELERDAQENDPQGWQRFRAGSRLVAAAAYMRLAEDQNCRLTHNRDACLLPIKDGGVHRLREGAEGAVRALQDVLTLAPGTLRARWLLNIAHMTLGSYPAGVPKEWLIPPEVFASDYPLPRFDNVAAEAGVDLSGLAGGSILEDFDGDRRLDLMWSSMGFTDQMRFFHNRGDGTFEDRTREAGLTGEVGGLNMVQADYDNDGDFDVLVLRGGWLGPEGRFPMSLLRNDGKGHFSDVTKTAGLLRFAPSQAGVWFDFDGDGHLDLFVGNESSWIPGFVEKERTPSDTFPCQLFHNNGDGTFTEMASKASLDIVGFVKGAVGGDFNGDGRVDLYVSLWGSPNRLYRNDGPAPGGGWRFTDVAGAAGVTEPIASFATFFFDYDNDGWLDLYVAGYGRQSGIPIVEDIAADYLGLPTDAARDRLYRNRGDGTFEDVTKAAGLYKVLGGMSLNYGDLDNDGWLDFYLGTGTPDLGMLVPNRMFRNAEGRRFQEVTTAGNFGHLQKGHGISFGDLDNDGDQDIYAQMGGAYLGDKAISALFRNPGNASAWLGLELVGVRASRQGQGARIKLTVDSPKGPRTIYRTVGTGGSFGASPLRQEIGLGAARRIDSVDILWPGSAEPQRIDGLEPRRRYRITQGDPKAEPVTWPANTAPKRPAATPHHH